MTAIDLAKATGTAERYVREWLAAQAAAGYAEYDAATHKVLALAGAGGCVRGRAWARLSRGFL